MPIEIGQLVINARIVAGEGSDRNTAGQYDQERGGGQKELIEQCINEVLRVLEQRQER